MRCEMVARLTSRTPPCRRTRSKRWSSAAPACRCLSKSSSGRVLESVISQPALRQIPARWLRDSLMARLDRLGEAR